MERIYSIDFIKFFAIFAVVVIHTFPLDHFTGYFIIDNIARFAVPFFFAASGYFFAQKMQYTDDTASYFKKYVLKLVKIYLSWLLFYMIFDCLLIWIKGVNVNQQLQNYFEDFTFLNLLYYGKGTSGYQLWFLTALIWCTVLLYIFYRWNVISLLLVIGFIFNIIGVIDQAYTMVVDVPVDNTRDTLFFGLFYTALGFLFATHPLLNKLRKIKGITYLGLAIIFSFLQVLEGFILDKKLSGSHGEYFFTTIFLTGFLFFFALNNRLLGKSLWITKVGANALGIYIIHVFFLQIAKKLIDFFDLNDLSENFFWNLALTNCVFFISYFSYNLLQEGKEKVKETIE